jgi:hypothetical protein
LLQFLPGCVHLALFGSAFLPYFCTGRRRRLLCVPAAGNAGQKRAQKGELDSREK